MTSPYEIILHPYVTEKTMGAMDRENKLEFVVRRNATKEEIRKAIETMFQARVVSVRTRIATDGHKHAIVRFASEFKAQDIGMRIGVF